MHAEGASGRPDGASPRETAGLTTRLILEYVAARRGEEGVRAVLARTGLTDRRERLEDERTWHSYEDKLALFAAAVAVTGDPAAARRIGESVLMSAVGAPLKLLISSIASTGGVLRAVARITPKFSTASELRADRVERGRALLRYRVREGYAPHRLDCDYTAGLLSQAPVLFGERPARVRQRACQVEGAAACEFEVTWTPQPRWRRRRRAETVVENAALRDQLVELRSAVLDLVSVDDLDELLDAIADRASTAVRAQRHLLAVRLEGEPAPRVAADGISPATARELGQRLLEDRLDPVDDGTILAVDVASNRRRYGRLAAFFPADQAFFAEEQELLQAYARLASAALDSATALHEARTGRRAAEAQLALATRLATCRDEASVTKALAERTPEVVGADRSTVYLLDEERRRLRVVARHGWSAADADRVDALVLDADELREVGAFVAQPGPVLIERETATPEMSALLHGFGTVAVAAVPLRDDGRLLGLVTAGWTRRAPRSDRRATLEARLSGLADQASVALVRARLYEQAQRRATHDELTGLPNRALFEDRATQAVARLRRTGQRFAVLYVDLDGFKQVNDRRGHEAGDALLRQVAERLRGTVRAVDTVARLGGDEFAVLVTDIDAAGAADVVADKLVAALAAPFRVDGDDVSVTMSLGVAIPDGEEVTVPDIVRRADHAMYAAKRAGGDRWAGGVVAGDAA